VTEPQALPKVTPYLLRRADSMCARRLAREYDGGERSHDPVHRSRMRDAFLAAARDAHATLRPPVPADFTRFSAHGAGSPAHGAGSPAHGAGSPAHGAGLEPEEQAVLAQAAHWYVQVFGDRAARWEDLGLDSPTVSPKRRLRIGGWIDLPVVTADGGFELRQLDLWGGRVPFDDPLDLEAVRVAVLRLARWAGDQPLRVVWADLVHGLVRERVVDGDADRAALAEWFDERVAIVRERAAEPEATMGADCGTCNFVAACPVHPTGAHYGRKRDVLPGILTVTPTGLDTWRRCPREWRDAYLYGIPSSDTDPGTVHGQQMHDVLRVVHEQGSCRDDAHVDDVLVAHGFDTNDRMRGELARHRTRCPDPAVALGHEITRARFLRHPSAPFMATARFDALWAHDGVLDARDYKTGQVWSDRVAEDAQARLQAWVLAPLAGQLGLTLRIAFEHLAAEVVDDPEPFEPDAEDLVAIGEELRHEVEAIRREATFAGVADPDVCHRCRYRSICPDSAAPGVAMWPVVEAEDPAEPSLG
jgi:PD-(D/E)XK nuclease superfamily